MRLLLSTFIFLFLTSLSHASEFTLTWDESFESPYYLILENITTSKTQIVATDESTHTFNNLTLSDGYSVIIKTDGKFISKSYVIFSDNHLAVSTVQDDLNTFVIFK